MSRPHVAEEPGEPPALDEFDQVLSYHDGNASAAVRTFLDDCRHLRQQLAIANSTISVGFGRGWRPSLNRD